jgi:hypothetical protein
MRQRHLFENVTRETRQNGLQGTTALVTTRLRQTRIKSKQVRSIAPNPAIGEVE